MKRKQNSNRNCFEKQRTKKKDIKRSSIDWNRHNRFELKDDIYEEEIKKEEETFEDHAGKEDNLTQDIFADIDYYEQEDQQMLRIPDTSRFRQVNISLHTAQETIIEGKEEDNEMKEVEESTDEKFLTYKGRN